MSKRKAEKIVRPVFDPQKSYSWPREASFAISGTELEILNNVLNVIAQDPAHQKALAVLEGLKVITNVIREAFEEGIITEHIPESENKTTED